jgi:DNA-binding NtrC family response regulator
MLTVLVADKDEAIRRALGDLLEDVGYAVTQVEDLREAEAHMESAVEPLVLVVGNADAVDQPGLQHLTVVAANPLTQQAFVSITLIPQRRRLPELIQRNTQPLDSMVDGPYELEHLLAVVATAAARARS